MYTPSPKLYLEVLTRLLEAIDGQNYYSGSFNFRFSDTADSTEQEPHEVDCLLRASVIVYSRTESQQSGNKDIVYNLIPVWWEFHTADKEGEFINDFSFNELKEYLQ